MKKRYYAAYEDLCEEMIKLAVSGEIPVAVLHYDGAASLIRELLLYDEVDIGAIDIEPEDFNGYNKEYYITLGKDLLIYVDPAYYINDDGEGIYLNACGDEVFYGGDVSSKIIAVNDGVPYEIEIEDELEEESCGDCCCDCTSCNRCELYEVVDDDGDVIGYSLTYFVD